MAQKSVDTRHLTIERPSQVALESFVLKSEFGKRQNYDEDNGDDNITIINNNNTANKSNNNNDPLSMHAHNRPRLIGS